jgi:disulfide bond formation protein DsbB
VNLFLRIGEGRLYWVAMITVGLALEIAALYYQYALNQYPCVLCIHIRIWVMAFIFIGIAGLFLRRTRMGLAIAGLLSVIASIGLLERSWQTLATERLWIEGSCSMLSGLPSWFALDQWFPAIFGVQASCGYTPVLLFGITMAEALMLISVVALAVTSLVTVATLRSKAATRS